MLRYVRTADEENVEKDWNDAVNELVAVFQYDEKPYCSHCYMKMFGPRGTPPSHEQYTQTHTDTHAHL